MLRSALLPFSAVIAKSHDDVRVAGIGWGGRDGGREGEGRKIHSLTHSHTTPEWKARGAHAAQEGDAIWRIMVLLHSNGSNRQTQDKTTRADRQTDTATN